ncbi:hypothetical protein [Streptomyces sp. NPDC006551]|uniref:hypothetical protein n=1 Tax=Streptomyces sp. NPDC006551 TaxID=3157178 RepID=UPI00339E55D1
MTDPGKIRLPRPGAGREPAASALLAWLTDPRAPRVCVLTGPTGAGKSHLLAWLVNHGEASASAGSRWRVHAVAPLAGGVSVRGAAWLLADDLGAVARAPAELLNILARDTRPTVLVVSDLHEAAAPDALLDQLLLPIARLSHVKLIIESRTAEPCTALLLDARPDSAVMDLAESQWTDPDGFRAWAATAVPGRSAAPADAYPVPGRVVGHVPAPRVPPVSASTVDAMLEADPYAVTAALEQDERTGEPAGDLRRAWLRAGQALCVAATPSARALTLLAALDDSADPVLRQRLAAVADPEPWRVIAVRSREATTRWAGPVAALAPGRGELAGTVLSADHLGEVHVLDSGDGSVRGRLPGGERRPARSVFCLPEGTVAVLDDWGGIGLVHRAKPAVTGLGSLVAPEPDPWEALRAAMLSAAADLSAETELTVATALPDGVAFGDARGRVHVLTRDNATSGPVSRTLHDGPVQALTAHALGADGPTLLHSGGQDGRVRAWGPSAEPLADAVRERTVPVSALSSGPEPDALAVAWADGHVEHTALDSGRRIAFRPGPPVRALWCAGGRLAVGMDEAIVLMEARSAARIPQRTIIRG